MENKKILTLSFAGAGALAAYVCSVLLTTLAAAFGVVAHYISNDYIIHGLPVVVGLAVFFYLQFNKEVLVWADEVIVEIKKVVWPSQKDTTAMTIVVCIFVVISGFCLAVFDLI